MSFEGRVFFSFGSRDVWEFYRFVRALAEQGETVALEWTPLIESDEGPAAETFLGLSSPIDRGRFLHAMLGLVHLEGRPADAEATVQAAARAAEISPVTASREQLDEAAALIRDLGVVDVPAIYRHGPVVAVKLNAAALEGDLRARAELIQSMLDDDGVWGLSKP